MVATSFIQNGIAQCPDGLMRFESQECSKPENARVYELNCTSLAVKWNGNPNQTYEIEAFLMLLSTKEPVVAKVNDTKCSDAGNCSASIEVVEGAFVTWNVIAKCNENGATVYSDKVEGEPALIPKCNKKSNLASLNVYPNPSNGKITVELLSYKSGILKIFVYSSTGTTRVETELEATAGIMLIQQFDFSAYAKGAYFFVARSGEESIEQRFLIE
jgi:hypothetical protein